jgi:acetyl-CoA carboxylase carboxyl transferase subunit alpha
MGINFLDFEQPIAELEAKIDELRHVTRDGGVDLREEIGRLQVKSDRLTHSIFGKLSPWQITQLARHPQRPYTLDHLSRAFTEFEELHGDRMFADDQALVGGLARLGGRPVMVVGHQKGRDTKERVRRNYGMPKPEGYRAFRAAAHHLHRHAGRLSRARVRGAGAERGHRSQPLRDGAVAGADRQRGDR